MVITTAMDMDIITDMDTGIIMVMDTDTDMDMDMVMDMVMDTVFMVSESTGVQDYMHGEDSAKLFSLHGHCFPVQCAARHHCTLPHEIDPTSICRKASEPRHRQ